MIKIFLKFILTTFNFIFWSIVYSLKCTTNNYHWGKLGNESTVADLAKAQGEDIAPETPYAEVTINI